MKFSHSKLSTFLKCPMTYHLKYDLGIIPKAKPKALDFGSAIHWGLEHNTSNLEQFYKENQTLRNFKNEDDKILQEVMIQSFLNNKEKIFDRILTTESGEKLELLGEEHEFSITSKLPSKVLKNESNEFTGIIDLLLITNKGFIIIDYKTSSQKPDFNEYLSQLYTYIYLLHEEFPNFPVYRIAIINLQKVNLKRIFNQTDIQYKTQLEKKYVLVGDDDDLIRINIFDRDIISNGIINKFVNDLAIQCDYVMIASTACKISNIFMTNWEAAHEYGGSPYLDLLENNKGAYTLYNVKDKSLIDGKIVKIRPMRPIDVNNIYNDVPIHFCRYESFKKIYNEDGFNSYLFDKEYEKYIDKDLINSYIQIFNIEKENEKNKSK